jgi:hypothetical protein
MRGHYGRRRLARDVVSSRTRRRRDILPLARMTKLYEYVGPARILEQVRRPTPGFEVRSVAGLRAWLQARGTARGGELTVTFVLDQADVLRLADRHAEHVVCAGGGPVRSAGEMTFALAGEQVRLVAASNQSTGFCPEPESWPEVQGALDRLGLPHAGGFTASFQFRRCPACGQINLIKEEAYQCDACDGELPRAWNFGQ